MSTQAIERVANYLWRKDGKPEYEPGEPTSVGHAHYYRQSRLVIETLLEMGYTIKRPRTATQAPKEAGK